MAVLTERHDKAVAINLLGRKVLMFDATGARAETWKNLDGSDATVISYPSPMEHKAAVKSRSGSGRCGCTVHRVTSNREIDKYNGSGDYFYLSKDMIGISADDWYGDYLEFAVRAQAPLIEEGDRVSIVVYDRNKKTAEVHTVIAGPTNDYYGTACEFTDEPEEEVRPLINRWLR